MGWHRPWNNSTPCRTAEQKPFCDKARVFLDKLVSHLWLDDGRLVVAHAGMKEEMQGRGSGAVREFRAVWRDDGRNG